LSLSIHSLDLICS